MKIRKAAQLTGNPRPQTLATVYHSTITRHKLNTDNSQCNTDNAKCYQEYGHSHYSVDTYRLWRLIWQYPVTCFNHFNSIIN
jgi:hypothetical protein